MCRLSILVLPMALLSTNLRGGQNATASALSYVERGNEWIAKKDLRRAIADFSLAIAFDENLPAAWLNRGLARIEARDLAGSISDLTRAIELQPHDARAYSNRAAAWYLQGNWIEPLLTAITR